MGTANVQLESVLSEAHAELLEWFLGPGTGMFGRSTCGAIIDHLQMYAFGSDPCDACKGTGFLGGWSYGAEAERKLTRAEELASLLEVPVETSKPSKPSEEDDRDARCEPCRGSGVQARTTPHRTDDDVTARPRTMAFPSVSYTMSDVSLQRYAVACRRLSVVAAINHRAAAILEAFYGDWGARWGDSNEGRLFAIYAFTPAGHKILRMSHEKVVNKDNELRPDEVLGVEFSLQKQQPNRRRGDLFTAARDQAKRLFAEACRAWNAAESDFAVRQLQLQEALEKSVRDDRVRKLVVHEDVHLHAASATFDRGDVAVVEAFAEAS